MKGISKAVFCAMTLSLLMPLVAACTQTAPPSPTAAPKAAASPTTAPVAPAASASAPAATAAATAAAPKAQGNPTKITFGVEMVGAPFWPLYVMLEKGFAKEENIDLELVVMPSPQATAALVGKSMDMTNVTVELVVRAIEQGENLAMIGGIANQALYSLVTAPDIKSVEQLRGKKIAVQTIEGSTTIILQKMLESKGLKKGDYDLVVAGGSNERWAALKAGGVQGANLSQPVDLAAMADGFNNLMFSADVVKDWQLDTVVIRRDWPKASPGNEATVMGFMRALVKACRWLNDPNNKQEAIQILAKVTKTDEKLIGQTYDLFMKYKVIPQEGEFSMEGVNGVLNLMDEMGGVFKGPIPAPEKYLDTSYWSKAAGKS